jgi:hypothetical protein
MAKQQSQTHMAVRLTHGVVTGHNSDGAIHGKPGDVVTFDRFTAGSLIYAGWAVPADNKGGK